jgi:putative intracellular protease/amidase
MAQGTDVAIERHVMQESSTDSSTETADQERGILTRRALGIGMALALGGAVMGPRSAVAAEGTKGKVLVVVSAARELELRNGKKYQTGFFLDELTIPVRKLIAAGFTPVYATPDGKPPVFDKLSNDKMFFGSEGARAAAVDFVTKSQGLARPQKLASVAAKSTQEYVALFIPGGHAPMQDLVASRDMGQILAAFHQNGRPTGVICHGPTALLSTLPDAPAFLRAMKGGDLAAASKLAAGWPYAGYRLTVFSSAEEQAIEGPGRQLGGQVQFHAADALAEAGAHVDRVAAFRSNVVIDRELVSGQQPFSSEAFGEAFLAHVRAHVAR